MTTVGKSAPKRNSPEKQGALDKEQKLWKHNNGRLFKHIWEKTSLILTYGIKKTWTLDFAIKRKGRYRCRFDLLHGKIQFYTANIRFEQLVLFRSPTSTESTKPKVLYDWD